MSKFSRLFPRPSHSAAYEFSREGMLQFETACRGYFVADRLPMRDCAAGKNCRHRYQVLSADQSECYLFRSLRKAIRHARLLSQITSGTVRPAVVLSA